MAKKITIDDLIMEFFKNNPNTEFRHEPIDEWVRERYLKVENKRGTGQDVRRAVRKLAETGRLIKPRRGVFLYDPEHDHETELLEFAESVKQEIFKRDRYQCVICGLGEDDGTTITADHKKPKSLGGDNTIENGQTLCSKHNQLKKNYRQTTAGKKYFIQTYETAVENNDEKMIAFCEAVFDLYDDFEYNGHIERPDKKQTLF